MRQESIRLIVRLVEARMLLSRIKSDIAIARSYTSGLPGRPDSADLSVLVGICTEWDDAIGEHLTNIGKSEGVEV